jgi:hypothetical protein
VATTPHHIAVRSARDRMIDLLGIGDTFPLTDLNVVADQLKVPFGGTARIPIEHAQSGVLYELCDPKGQPLGNAFRGEGRDATLIIDTPPVHDNITYRIRATKLPWSPAHAAQTPRYLDEPAPVEVGLDTGLVIEFAECWMPGLPAPVEAPLLDAANAHPQPGDPRLVPFGSSLNVRVNNSQEGVQYSLIVNGADVPEMVRTGDLAAILLRTPPMSEDAVIEVRATKTFLATEDRRAETRPLTAKLFLKVKANPSLLVSSDAAPAVAYQGRAVVTIAATQKSASYVAYVQSIPDRAFAHGATGKHVVTIPVPGKPDVQVLSPSPADVWRDPEGFTLVSGAAMPGTGGAVTFTLNVLTDDTMVLVRAVKQHEVVAGAPQVTIPSAVFLERAAVVLVRPDPDRALALRVPITGTRTGALVQVSGGQPGVFYFFRPAPSGAEFPLAPYFHKLDDLDGRQNKGVGQLGLEIDFAIAANPDVLPDGAVDLARLRPRTPLLDITPVEVGSSLAVRAVKAQTNVDVPMAKQARVTAGPAVHAAPDVVDLGASAQVVIAASTSEDQYELTVGGTVVQPATAGTGADLALDTGPLRADTAFEVTVTSSGNQTLRVTRVLGVSVRVRPDATLPVAPTVTILAAGASADVIVERTQVGVSYQLMNGDAVVGALMPGTGRSLALPTGPITADTTFSVVAERADDPRIRSVLATRALVKFAPAP